MKIWKKLCELKGQSPSTGRGLEKRIRFEGKFQFAKDTLIGLIKLCIYFMTVFEMYELPLCCAFPPF